MNQSLYKRYIDLYFTVNENKRQELYTKILLDRNMNRSYGQIAKDLNLSRMRIQQIEQWLNKQMVEFYNSICVERY